jgi:hypothetical protein
MCFSRGQFVPTADYGFHWPDKTAGRRDFDIYHPHHRRLHLFGRCEK